VQEDVPSFSNMDFIRTFCANGTCMTSYTEKRISPRGFWIFILLLLNLVIDVGVCILFRGLAFIPRLYRFLGVLWDCQIQTVNASSERCQSVDGWGRYKTGTHLFLSITL
jgi:hypothetical protein